MQQQNGREALKNLTGYTILFEKTVYVLVGLRIEASILKTKQILNPTSPIRKTPINSKGIFVW